MMRRISKRAWVKTLVAATTLLAIVYLVDFTLVLAALKRVSSVDIATLAALSFALIAVSVWKWGCFLRRLGISVGFWRLFRLYLVGYFINLLAPSFVGGDVVRSLYVSSSVDKARAVSATFLERYTGVVAMLLLAVFSVFLSAAVTTQIKLLVIALALGCLVSSWLLFSGKIALLTRRFGLPAQLASPIARVQSALVWGVGDLSLTAKALGISLVFHGLTVVNTAAVGSAVGWAPVPFMDLLVVVPLILLVGAIPISPQGLGIQEGAFVYFLSSVGVSPDHALAMALVLRAKSYALALLGGLLWPGVRHNEVKVSRASA